MKKYGQLLKCDRCGKEVFREKIGTKEMDGGYTVHEKFEELSVPWGFIDGNNLCPDCTYKYDQVMSAFMMGEGEE